MSNLNQNFIAGEWLAGSDQVANINPSDLSDTIGHYAQADSAQLQRALDAAQAAQREWGEAGIERRYNVLMAIGNELIAEYRDTVLEAPDEEIQIDIDTEEDYLRLKRAQ